MAVWELSTEYKKNAVEVQIWCRDGVVVKKIEGYRWGTFYCESDEKPDIDLRNPDNEYELGYSGYDWELDNLNDGCWTEWQFPDDMPESEQNEIEAAWDENYYEGLEDLGWDNTDTDYYFQGPLRLENKDTGEVFSALDKNGNVIPEEIEPPRSDWFPISIAPVRVGSYEIKDNTIPNWPFPVFADWDGTAWTNTEATFWRGLAEDPSK